MEIRKKNEKEVYDQRRATCEKKENERLFLFLQQMTKFLFTLALTTSVYQPRRVAMFATHDRALNRIKGILYLAMMKNLQHSSLGKPR